MTYDKIVHYLGKELVLFISSLAATKLQQMKKDIIQDMNLHKLGSEILFKRTIELEYINNLLKN